MKTGNWEEANNTEVLSLTHPVLGYRPQRIKNNVAGQWYTA